MELVNLTSHPLRFYTTSTPDQIADPADGFLFALDPIGQMARVFEYHAGTIEYANMETYTHGVQGVPVELIQYSNVVGLPPRRLDTYLIVPLVTALALRSSPDGAGRDDVVAPYSQVRDMNGTVVGCRALARPC